MNKATCTLAAVLLAGVGLGGCGDDEAVAPTDSTSAVEPTPDHPAPGTTFEERLQEAREAKAGEAKNPEEYIICLNSDGTLAGTIHGHPRPGVKVDRSKAFKENACAKQFDAKWELPQ